MQNDPELNGKYLGTITKDFVKVADFLKDASYQIRKRKLSDYPIFVISQTPTPLGVLLIEPQQYQNDWIYAASYSGEFIERGLIGQDKELDFVAAYKNADEFCCLFVVDKEFTSFVFLPYPED